MEEDEYYSEIKEYLSKNVLPVAFSEEQKNVLRKRADKYEVKKGVLYRVMKDSALKVVTSLEERRNLVKHAHAGIAGGEHRNLKNTIRCIHKESGSHWSHLSRDVQNYLLTCVGCNVSMDNLQKLARRDKNTSKMNWREVGLEILGPFYKTDNNSEYVAIVVDPVSRWVEGGVLKSVCSKEVSDFLFKTFLNLGFCQCVFIGVDSKFAELTNEYLLDDCETLPDVLKQISSQFCGDSESDSKVSDGGILNTSHFNDEMQACNAGESLQFSGNHRSLVSTNILGNVFSFIKQVISPTTQQRENELTIALGEEFSLVLQQYTQGIHSLVESNPLTWDKEIARTLFQLRTKTPEGCKLSPFSAMLRREPIPSKVKLRTITTCDHSDSDSLIDDDDDESGGEASTILAVQEEREVAPAVATPKQKQKANVRNQTCEGAQVPENDAAYIPPRGVSLGNSSPGAATCSSNITSRYGLRTTLKAKGDSSMVERFLRLSSAKRALPQTDVPEKNTTPKRRKKAITSPTADERRCVKVKEELVSCEEEHGIVESAALTVEKLFPQTETARMPEIGTPSSEMLSVQESVADEAIVIKIPEQISLLKSNQIPGQISLLKSNQIPEQISLLKCNQNQEQVSLLKCNQNTEQILLLKSTQVPESISLLNSDPPETVDDGAPSDVIELAAEVLQDVPKEVHVTIVADNDIPSTLESEQRNANIKAEPLSEDDRADASSIDHTSLPKKRRRKGGKCRKMEKELPHKCPKCVATYLSTTQELKLHLECHIPGEKLLRCPHCPKTVRNWSHLQRHLLTHDELAPLIRNIPEDKRKCTFCGKIFSTREGMLRHEQVIHKEFHRFECKVCGRKYKERKTFKRHMDLHANVVYKCEECKYKTKIRRNLIDHNRIHEGRGFQCEVCSKIFTKQSILLGHMEIHNTNRSSLICEQCGMKLANVASLRQHVRNIHEKPGRFPCELCDYIGKTKGNLMSHTDRAHNKPFKCPNCAYSCKSDSALKRHTDIFHNVLERRFACTACPYRARDSKQLSEHMRFRHNPNALRFPCQFCSMKFKTMTTLRHHLPAHTGQHLYSCQLCGYSAKYRQTVHHHVKVKHPGQRVSNLVKGTPCSEIPCSVLTETQLNQAIARVANQECTVYMPEGVVIAEQEPGLFVAKILETAKGDVAENVIAETTDVSIITAEDESITIPSNSTIELQFITEEENGKNIAMKIVPTQEQTEKAVELLLLAMDPHQTVTEVVSEETVHTTE